MDETKSIKRLIWLYFWLLMFEGALRKWVVPGLSNPLLIVRDPVVIAIYFAAANRGLFPNTAFIGWCAFLAVISLAMSLMGTGTLYVTLFGLRANYLHLPLIFVMPKVLTIEDVKKIGKWWLMIVPLMTFLSVQQFRSGPGSWYNVGAGGNLGGQLGSSSGKVRASGTFSFINGLVAYLTGCASFLLYHFMQGKVYTTWLGWTALGGVILTLGVSGSRSAVVAVTVVCGTVIYICLRLRGRFDKALRPALMVLAAVFLLIYIVPVFSEGIAVHRDRFIGGGGLKEGIFMRYFKEFPDAIEVCSFTPALGKGIGVGTNAGAGLLTGSRSFLLAESEWARVVMELGPIIGFAYIGLRVAIVFYVGFACSRALARGNILPILLFAAGFLEVFNGQFGQPTILGFAVFTTGLALAAAQPGQEAAVVAAGEALSPPIANHLVRGRSDYAEALRRGVEK